MADFCKQCSLDHFGEDFGDLANLGEPVHGEEGTVWAVICEGCGPIYVNVHGECQTDCALHHKHEDKLDDD